MFLRVLHDFCFYLERIHWNPKNFGKLQETLSIPNLIEVQKKSFSSFVEKSLEKKKSIYSKGLTRVFESVFPINDASEKSSLEFIGYSLS